MMSLVIPIFPSVEKLILVKVSHGKYYQKRELVYSRIRTQKITQNKYKTVIIAVIILGLFFLIATSGRYVFPQILQLIKLGLPFLTKFIGI